MPSYLTTLVNYICARMNNISPACMHTDSNLLDILSGQHLCAAVVINVNKDTDCGLKRTMLGESVLGGVLGVLKTEHICIFN